MGLGLNGAWGWHVLDRATLKVRTCWLDAHFTLPVGRETGTSEQHFHKPPQVAEAYQLFKEMKVLLSERKPILLCSEGTLYSRETFVP